MTEPVLRRACDRCHLSKLSCQREGDASCTRCLKANKPCNTSPSLRNKRSRPTQHPLTPDGTERGSQNKAQRHDNLATENDGRNETHHTVRAIEEESPKEVFTPPSTWAQFSPTLDVGLDWASSENILAPLQTSGVSEYFPKDSIFGSASSSSASTAATARTDWSVTMPHLDADVELPPITSSDGDLSGVSKEISSSFMDMQNANGLFILPPNWGSVESRDSGTLNYDHRNRNNNRQGSQAGSQPDSRIDHPINLGLSSNLHSKKRSISRPQTANSQGKIDMQWFLKLSEINVKLFSQGRESPEAMRSQRGAAGSNTAASNPQFDGVLVLVFQFMQLIRELRDSEADPSAPIFGNGGGTTPVQDPGTSLMVLSCYVRVLRISTDLLGRIKCAIDSSALDTLSSIQIPAIVAGPLRLDDYPAIRLRLALELLESALEPLKTLLGTKEKASYSGEQSRWDRILQGAMPKDSQEDIIAQEQAVYELIEQIRIGLRKMDALA